uniref:Glyoxalase domain containing 4 n=1 Tax=Anolis carolinensis TaxID=28377 RepID=H9GMU0_ANOCA
MEARRALHFVFKVGDRAQTARFYREILGMRVLRHEEFDEGCKATCNGPYDGKWSKTMVGFGPEDSHFVAELTYNYGVGRYRLGNDFLVKAPGGYKFFLEEKDPVMKVALAVSNLAKSRVFWSELLGMKVYEEDKGQQRVLLGFQDDQCKLELQGIGQTVDHGSAFGRIAFSCPKKQLPDIEALMKKENQKILTPLLSLETPGKATVQVVILADPDGHEICFVGDEAFRELSQVDPKGEALLDENMAADKSQEWFAKHNIPKPSA